MKSVDYVLLLYGFSISKFWRCFDLSSLGHFMHVEFCFDYYEHRVTTVQFLWISNMKLRDMNVKSVVFERERDRMRQFTCIIRLKQKNLKRKFKTKNQFSFSYVAKVSSKVCMCMWRGFVSVKTTFSTKSANFGQHI